MVASFFKGVFVENKQQETLSPEQLSEAHGKARDYYRTIVGMMISMDTYGKNFFGQFLMQMRVQWTDKVPTAGVSITDGLNLYINPVFWNTLEPLMAMEILEHEIEHIIYMHPLRMKQIGDVVNPQNQKLHNIAADAKINEKLPTIRDDGRFVSIKRINDELAQKGSSDRLVDTESSENFYWTMKKNQDVNDDDMSGYGEVVDSHDQWSESIQNEAMAKQMVTKAGNDAVRAAGIGNVPKEILEQIQRLSASLVNWKQQLRQFFANALKADWEGSRSRRNSRTGILQPGKRKKQKLKIAMCMDSSGSVSNESFAQVFAELDAIMKAGNVEIVCIDADCEVAAAYDYKKGMKAERRGSGGTAYSPAINKARELKVDGIIYAGDMDAADTPENPKMPFLWLVVNSQSKPPGNFGKTVYVETK